MSEQRTDSIFKDVLSGEILESALDFERFLHENELNLAGNAITYDGIPIAYMHVDGGKDYPSPWTIWSDGDYSHEHEDVAVDDHIKEIAWANANICADCGSGCAPGKTKTIFGKELNNICSASMAFHVPNADTLRCIKKLLEMRKIVIAELLD